MSDDFDDDWELLNDEDIEFLDENAAESVEPEEKRRLVKRSPPPLPTADHIVAGVKDGLKARKKEDHLFHSCDKKLTSDIAEYWASAADLFLSNYNNVSMDGTEDSYRLRMIASSRLAQLGFCMFQFFGASAEALTKGKSDSAAGSSVNTVVALTIQNKIKTWLDLAEKGMN
jgi:hypothetical protein